MAELNINEAIQLMKKCKNMLISGESSTLDSELIIIDEILNLLKIHQTNDKSINQVKKEKFKDLELLLKNEEFTKVLKNYMVKFPESIFIDEPAFLEYWSHLTSMEKESLSLVELKIAYYLITKNFDSRVKVKKDEFLARIDDLVSIRNRRENLSQSTMNQK
jgi:hypothetical protein